MEREEHVLLIAEIVQKQRRDGLSEGEVKKATEKILKMLIEDEDIDKEIAKKTFAIIFNDSLFPEKKKPKASTAKPVSTPIYSPSYGSSSGSSRGGC